MHLLVFKPLINKIGFVEATSFGGWVLGVSSFLREHVCPTPSQDDLMVVVVENNLYSMLPFLINHLLISWTVQWKGVSIKPYIDISVVHQLVSDVPATTLYIILY